MVRPLLRGPLTRRRGPLPLALCTLRTLCAAREGGRKHRRGAHVACKRAQLRPCLLRQPRRAPWPRRGRHAVRVGRMVAASRPARPGRAPGRSRRLTRRSDAYARRAGGQRAEGKREQTARQRHTRRGGRSRARRPPAGGFDCNFAGGGGGRSQAAQRRGRARASSQSLECQQPEADAGEGRALRARTATPAPQLRSQGCLKSTSCAREWFRAPRRRAARAVGAGAGASKQNTREPASYLQRRARPRAARSARRPRPPPGARRHCCHRRARACPTRRARGERARRRELRRRSERHALPLPPHHQTGATPRRVRAPRRAATGLDDRAPRGVPWAQLRPAPPRAAARTGPLSPLGRPPQRALHARTRARARVRCSSGGGGSSSNSTARLSGALRAVSVSAAAPARRRATQH